LKLRVSCIFSKGIYQFGCRCNQVPRVDKRAGCAHSGISPRIFNLNFNLRSIFSCHSAFHMYCITPRLLEYIQILWMQNVLLPPSQLSPCIPHDPPSCSQPSSMLLNYPEHVISSSSLAAHKPSSKPHATLKCHVYPGHRWWQILLYQHHFGRAEFLSHDRHG
jgi:hypothetical protein